VQDCVIAGRFEGKLFVHGRLSVRATGRICGDVQYSALEVEAGAKIEGPLTAVTQEIQDVAPVPVLAVLPPVQDNVEPLFSSEDDDDTNVTGRSTAYRRATRV
jgi:cytoskeletal protein CcmA (bactofilin family)